MAGVATIPQRRNMDALDLDGETWGFLPADLIWLLAWRVDPLARCRMRALSRAWWSVLERPDAWVDVSGDFGCRLGAVTAVAERGVVEAFDWMARNFGLDAGDTWGVVSPAHSYPALAVACAGGHLEVARRFAALAGDSGAGARAYNNAAVYAACEQGHTAVVRWLVTAFDLRAEDVSPGLTAEPAGNIPHPRPDDGWAADQTPYPNGWLGDDNGAFAAACENGHLEVARWLAGRLPITPGTAHAALRCAFASRQSCVLVWLIDVFDLEVSLREAALGDDDDDLHWLVDAAGGMFPLGLGAGPGADPDPYAPYHD
jgi:hypothetical protein